MNITQIASLPPFEWRPFNQATQEAIEDARLGRNLITADSVEDIFRNLDNDYELLNTFLRFSESTVELGYTAR